MASKRPTTIAEYIRAAPREGQPPLVRVTASVAVAAVALVVSILGLVISKLSYDRSGRVHAQQQAHLALQSQGALLALMSDCGATLNATRVDICALKAVYDAEPGAVKALLVNFIGLFTEYLPKVEQSLQGAVVVSNAHLTIRWSARVGDRVPSPNLRSSGAQRNRYVPT
jgi:hypothetical protein